MPFSQREFLAACSTAALELNAGTDDQTKMPMRTLGVIAMKVFGQEALSTKAPINKLIQYSLSLPVSACVMGMPKPEPSAAIGLPITHHPSRVHHLKL